MTIRELIKELEAIPDALKDTVVLRAQYNRNRDCRYDEIIGVGFWVINVDCGYWGRTVKPKDVKYSDDVEFGVIL